MAIPGRPTVLVVVLLGLLDCTPVWTASWGQKHFFHLAAYEENGCLPEGFERDLPASLWVNAITCRRQHPIDSTAHHHSHAPGAQVPTQRQKRALYLQCLAQKLGFITDTGIAEDRLDAFIDTLPAGRVLTDGWKRFVDHCQSEMIPNVLSPDQQAVFLLSCLRASLPIVCARGTDWLCLKAKYLHQVKFSGNSTRLDSPITWRRCAAQQARDNPSAFTDSEKTDADFCPELLARAVGIASCVLRDTGHTSGDNVNTTAVRETLVSSQDDQHFISRRLAALYQCSPGNPSVGAFVHCWSNEALGMALAGRAYELAMALPVPPSSQ